MTKTAKFNDGDRVRCIAPGETGGFRTGKTYEVQNTYWDESGERIHVVVDSAGSDTNGWGVQHFELVKKPKKPRKPKTPKLSRESFAHSFTPGGIPEKAFEQLVTTGSAMIESRLVDPYAEETKQVLGTQVGGTHYTDCKVQPISYIWANGLGFSEGNVVKYVTRWKTKGGIKDLKKAHHHIALLIEHAEAEEARIGHSLYGLQA